MDSPSTSLNWQERERYYFKLPECQNERGYNHQLKCFSIDVSTEISKTNRKSALIFRSCKKTKECAYLNKGVLNRLYALEFCFGKLIEICAADRVAPLIGVELVSTQIYLDNIYINMSATLENYLIFFFFSQNNRYPERTENLNLSYSPDKDKRKWLKKNIDPSAIAILQKYDHWTKDLSVKRNNVAHHIPQAVIGAEVSVEESKVREKLWDEIHKNWQSSMKYWTDSRDPIIMDEATKNIQNFNVRNDEYFMRMRSIGTFPGLFSFDGQKNLHPIHPTIPQDVANLLMIAEEFNQVLQ